MAAPIPNWMMASIPETALEMNAAADEITARNRAGKTRRSPLTYDRGRVLPSTCCSRARPLAWTKKSTPNAISEIGAMKPRSMPPSNPIRVRMALYQSIVIARPIATSAAAQYDLSRAPTRTMIPTTDNRMNGDDAASCSSDVRPPSNATPNTTKES